MKIKVITDIPVAIAVKPEKGNVYEALAVNEKGTVEISQKCNSQGIVLFKDEYAVL